MEPEWHWRTDNNKPPGEPDYQTLAERRLDKRNDSQRIETFEGNLAESCRKWGIPFPGNAPKVKIDEVAQIVNAAIEEQGRRRERKRVEAQKAALLEAYPSYARDIDAVFSGASTHDNGLGPKLEAKFQKQVRDACDEARKRNLSLSAKLGIEPPPPPRNLREKILGRDNDKKKTRAPEGLREKIFGVPNEEAS